MTESFLNVYSEIVSARDPTMCPLLDLTMIPFSISHISCLELSYIFLKVP